MRTRALILSVLLVFVAAVTAAAAPVPVPESDPSPMLFVGQARLKGETAALGKLLMGPSPVRYRFIFVEDIGDEDREAYLDRVLAASGWPAPDQLLLVIFTKANHDVRFAMGANFAAAGVTVSEMVGLLRTEFFPVVHSTDPAQALARFVGAVNQRMAGDGFLTPRQVVERFYDWHLGYFASNGERMSANPLVDKAYRKSPYLAPEMIAAADKSLAEMAASGGGADPFLCAQNLPLTLTVSAAEETGPAQAQVLVRKGWGEGRETALTVRLAQRDGRWEISRISCSAP